MTTGYTRNDTSNNIANGNVVDADDLDGEFDAIVAAFDPSTGHNHNGASGEGSPIISTGPNQEYLSDATALYPKATNTYDLGKTGAKWKDLYLEGDLNVGDISTDALTVSGDIVVTGTVDGRDVATDGTKLDGIETGATADQTGAEIKAAYEAESNTNAFTDSEKTKLTGIETGADVTDTANVTAAGALMDSEVTNLADVKAFDPADYATPDDVETASLSAQTGTTYTLVIGDRGQIVTMSNASANTVTIPTNASVSFDTGSVVTVIQIGAGDTTVEGATGVTVNGTSGGSVTISNQYQGVSLLKIASDTWVASGAI